MENEIKELKSFVTEQINAKIAEHAAAIKEGSEGGAERIKAEIKGLLDANVQRVDAIDAEIQKVKAQGGSAGRALVSAADFIAEQLRNEKADAYKRFKETKRGGLDISMSRKAVGDMTLTGEPGADGSPVVDNVYLPGIYADVFRQNRLRGILPVGTMAGDRIPYVTQTGGEGDAGITGEGLAKNKIDQDIALQEAIARKITAYVTISEEMLNDLPAMSTFVGYSLTNKVMDEEDTQILLGSGSGTPAEIKGLSIDAQDAGNISGFTVVAPNDWDAIIAAKAHIASLNYNCNVVAMNPVDLYAMAASKGENGQYVAPIFWTNGIPTLWGQPIYMTTAIPAGSLLAMDGSRAAQLFQRAPLSIRFYDQNDDNAVKNLITVVGEERLALPIFYPDAVFYDTFANIKTAIEVS